MFSIMRAIEIDLMDRVPDELQNEVRDIGQEIHFHNIPSLPTICSHYESTLWFGRNKATFFKNL